MRSYACARVRRRGAPCRGEQTGRAVRALASPACLRHVAGPPAAGQEQGIPRQGAPVGSDLGGPARGAADRSWKP